MPVHASNLIKKIIYLYNINIIGWPLISPDSIAMENVSIHVARKIHDDESQ